MELVDAVPAECATLLAAARVDAALVPVIEYQRIANISLVPEVCVGSRREVRSVVLASKHNELSKIHRVALDQSSRTSAALVKIIFLEFVGHEPQWITAKPDVAMMLREHDAALIIGDPGMTFPRGDLRIWDMASLWRDFTGLGFVFAMWMARDDCFEKLQRVDFDAALVEGLDRLQEIIRHYEGAIGMSREEVETYLKENISFRVVEDMEAGMRLYFELARKHGLINALTPLRFTRR